MNLLLIFFSFSIFLQLSLTVFFLFLFLCCFCLYGHIIPPVSRKRRDRTRRGKEGCASIPQWGITGKIPGYRQKVSENYSYYCSYHSLLYQLPGKVIGFALDHMKMNCAFSFLKYNIKPSLLTAEIIVINKYN